MTGLKYTINVAMYQCTNVPMYQCTNVREQQVSLRRLAKPDCEQSRLLGITVSNRFCNNLYINILHFLKVIYFIIRHSMLDILYSKVTELLSYRVMGLE